MFKWSWTIFSLGAPVGVPILFTACTFNFNSRSLMPSYYCHDFYLNDPQVLKAFSSENEPQKSICLKHQVIIWRIISFVSTWAGFIRISSTTKPNSRVTGTASVFVVTADTDLGFGKFTTFTTNGIESFLVTVVLQGGITTNQRFPRVINMQANSLYFLIAAGKYL